MAARSEIARKLMFLGELVGHSATTPMAGVSQQPTLVNEHQLGVTFIGHSSFLLQIGGQSLLIDPVFARWLVVLRRMREPGLQVEGLPPLDAVLLSHAHMDHLNRPSLREIVDHNLNLTGKAPVAIVPWGVRDLVEDLGFARVISLEWWKTTHLGDVEITMTPAKHWGARLFNDTHRGFGGYVLRAAGHSVYHSGDTAYFPGFAEIGQRLAPAVALLPIGAYYPDNFRSVHTSPEDALRGFLDLSARWMIPMHFGTFRLSQEPVAEPVPRLMEAARKAGVERSVCPLAEGETRIFDHPGFPEEHLAPEFAVKH